ncbi:MAG: hypothetical protein NC834_02605 [Candidatus Omnitrophica bacterium]|nr:hypothetical protein [Candidatus Omnitrophota bacterium]
MENNIPLNTDNQYPRNTELDICPSNTEKKEKYRDNINRDKDIDKSAGSACPHSQASPAFSEEIIVGKVTYGLLDMWISIHLSRMEVIKKLRARGCEKGEIGICLDYIKNKKII